jgi:hypothetical protein
MDELSPRARALLEAAHGTDDPIRGDAARVRRNVLTRIGTTGLGAAVFSLSLERAKALLGIATPKVVALVLIAVGGSAVYQHARQRDVSWVSAPVSLPSAKVSASASPVPAVSAAALAAESVPLSVEPPAPARDESRPHRAKSKRIALTRAVDPNSGLEAEMRCVRAADAALRGGNVVEAEGLLEQHAREFPAGALSEERDGLRIVASCQSGESDSQRAAAQFLERAPRSLLAGRVRAACSPQRNGG